jgi:hypothetical protein
MPSRTPPPRTPPAPYDPRTSRAAALASAVLFAVAALYDLWHVVTAQGFGGQIALWLTVVVGLVNASVWGTAAALLVLRPRLSERAVRAAFAASLVGVLLVFVHGLVLRGALRDPAGIAFVLGALVLAVLVRLAWLPIPGSQDQPPSGPVSRRTVPTPLGERPAI